MRIAQVSPLYESVPPRLYGGTERIVSHLTEGLVRRGHDVTLFASGDSRTSARLVTCCPSALRLDAAVTDPLGYHLCMLDEVARCADDFDLIHSHVDYLGYPFLDRCGTPCVTTLHGRLDIPELRLVYRRFRHLPFVSISDAQRTPLPAVNWVGTVYHGLPDHELVPRYRAGEYLAFVGRISREKRLDRAIEIARRAGLRLRIAAKVDPADKGYFEKEIEPLLDHPLIEFIGEVDLEQKSELLGGALAMLFPIDWPEPFGLVMIESMACGTPVVAFRGGSVDEIVQDGVSGYVVETIDEAVEALGRIEEVDRERCRAYFEEMFDVDSMVDAYLDVYERVIGLSPRTKPLRIAKSR